jgi:hypothetical protein
MKLVNLMFRCYQELEVMSHSGLVLILRLSQYHWHLQHLKSHSSSVAVRAFPISIISWAQRNNIFQKVRSEVTYIPHSLSFFWSIKINQIYPFLSFCLLLSLSLITFSFFRSNKFNYILRIISHIPNFNLKTFDRYWSSAPNISSKDHYIRVVDLPYW